MVLSTQLIYPSPKLHQTSPQSVHYESATILKVSSDHDLIVRNTKQHMHTVLAIHNDGSLLRVMVPLFQPSLDVYCCAVV
mmetsp:Transcript_20516/g.62574  ORF Transcript_20516/g.62574 Transcript_20516/m.62574 type:complete len:80 (+) Transcript_20516:89-328(+)